MSTPNPSNLLDQVRQVLRLRHYSIHTERAYCDWIKRFVRYHGMTRREDLREGEVKIEAFLTHFVAGPELAHGRTQPARKAAPR